ncbi:MAG: hypothetical protein LBU76_08140 [Azoarcus sp.]|nr:hypothetical protein [Azoarcus sp.]
MDQAQATGDAPLVSDTSKNFVSFFFTIKGNVMGEPSQQKSYDGDIMHPSHLSLDFTMVYAVVVSGTSWNPCGHMLLKTRSGYFHVAEIKGRPRHMTEEGYKRYLVENGKREIRRTYVSIPNPGASYRKLQELLVKDWSWWVLPNNCAAFVEDVVRAGGSDAGLYFNCPTRERFR